MKRTVSSYIKADPRMDGPFVLVKANKYMDLGLWEVRGQDGAQHGSWYITFNGNSKQRRQQARKLIRDLNQ